MKVLMNLMFLVSITSLAIADEVSETSKLEEDAAVKSLKSQLYIERGVAACEAGRHGHGLMWLLRAYEQVRHEDPTLCTSARNLIAGWAPFARRTRLSHRGPVDRVIFSPDSCVLATASMRVDGVVWILRTWDVSTGQLLAECNHDGRIRDIAFTPDSRIVVTAGTDHTARLWDVYSGATIFHPLRHDDEVVAVAISTSGIIATASGDGNARLWETRSGTLIASPLKHDGPVNAVAFSPDGKLLATGSSDKTARIWDTRGVSLGPPFVHSAGVRQVRFQSGSGALVTISGDTIDAKHAPVPAPNTIMVQVWNRETREPMHDALSFDASSRPVVISPNGMYAAASDAENSVEIWDLVKMQPIGKTSETDKRSRSVTFSPDSTLLLIRAGNRVHMWDVPEGRWFSEAVSHNGLILSTAIAADHRTVAIGSGNALAHLSFVAVGASHDGPIYPIAPASPPMAYSCDGRYVATGQFTGAVTVREVGTGRLVREVNHEGGVDLVTLGPDGGQLLTAGMEGPAILWNVATGRQIGAPLEHADRVVAAAFNADGQLVITAGSDRTGRLWDAETAQPLGKPLEHDTSLAAVAFSPNGSRVIIGAKGQVCLWSLAPGGQENRVLNHEGTVSVVSWSGDGQTFLTASGQTAQLWDTGTLLPRGVPLPHAAKILAADFSPDSATVATSDADGSIRLWDVFTGQPHGARTQLRRDALAIAFAVDRGSLLAGVFGDSEEVLPVPGLPDEPQRIRLWVETTTGLRRDEQGTLLPLSGREWLERRRKLAALGGAPAVP